MNSTKIFLSLIFILVLAVGASVYTEGFTDISFGKDDSTLSEETVAEAKEKALTLINGQLVRPGTEVEITKVQKDQGLYKLTIDVAGNELSSYMTTDFSAFFPSMLEMDGDVAKTEEETPEPQEIVKSDKPTVQLFTMAFCPYGNQAEELMAPVAELLGESVEIEAHYIFYKNYQGGGSDYCIDEESKYCSMHGAAEARQDIRERCVYNDQREKFWDFVLQVNKDCSSDDVDTCWENAVTAVGADAEAVRTCFDKNKLSYATEEQALTDKLEITGSPALVINGARYQGDRTAEAYKTAICSAFNNPPQECEQVCGAETETENPSGSCE